MGLSLPGSTVRLQISASTIAMLFYVVLTLLVSLAVSYSELQEYAYLGDLSPEPSSYIIPELSHIFGLNERDHSNERNVNKHIYKGSHYGSENNAKANSRIDKHIYLHVVPPTSEEINRHNQDKYEEKIDRVDKHEKEADNNDNSAQENTKAEINKEEKPNGSTENKEWSDAEEHKVESSSSKDSSQIDKHIYLHVVSPSVRQVTVKHPIPPQLPKQSQLYKGENPGLPVIPVVPIEPKLYLVNKQSAQPEYRHSSFTLRPDYYYV